MATHEEVMAYVRNEERETRELLRQLSPLAWKWAMSYEHGSPAPSPDSSRDELLGWRAYRRGYTSPPVWLREEMTKKKMRQ